MNKYILAIGLWLWSVWVNAQNTEQNIADQVRSELQILFDLDKHNHKHLTVKQFICWDKQESISLSSSWEVIKLNFDANFEMKNLNSLLQKLKKFNEIKISQKPKIIFSAEWGSERTEIDQYISCEL